MSNIKPTSKAPFNVTHENMIRSVIAFALNATNVAITNSIAAFAALINLINGNITTIDSLRASIAQPIKGYAAQKKAVKTALAALSANIMKAAYTYANDTGDQVLAAQMKISQSDLLKMKYVDLVTFTQGAIDLINTIIGDLSPYNVTAGNITTWQLLHDQLDTLISNPKNAITNRKSVNENIQSLLRQCMVILWNNADELAFQFRDTNLNYYNGYVNNRRLYPHSLSTQLRIWVTTILGSPVTQGDVYIAGTDASGSLDNNGYCLVDDIPFGNHEVILSVASGDHAYGPFDFKKGQSLTLHEVVPVQEKKAPSTVKKKKTVSVEK